jgi:hypothetical protein
MIDPRSEFPGGALSEYFLLARSAQMKLFSLLIVFQESLPGGRSIIFICMSAFLKFPPSAQTPYQFSFE